MVAYYGMSDDDLITAHEAARIIGVSGSHVYEVIRSGRLPSVRRFGLILVRRSDAVALDRDGWPGRGRGPAPSEARA